MTNAKRWFCYLKWDNGDVYIGLPGLAYHSEFGDRFICRRMFPWSRSGVPANKYWRIFISKRRYR